MPILMDTSQRLPWAHVPRSRDFQKLSMSLSAHPCGRLQAPRGAFECRFQATTLVFSLAQPERLESTKKSIQTSYFQELAWQPAQLVTMTAGTVRGLSGDSAVTEGDSG